MFLLSIGHYPEAPGAKADDGTSEYDIASDWVERIEEVLEAEGFPIQVVPTGHLREKVSFIHSCKDVEFCAELHFNANIENAKGSETLYYPFSGEGKKFAEIIQEQFKAREIFQPDRGAKEGWYYEDGEKTGDIPYFLEETPCPAVIIEPDFLSQLDDIHENFYLGTDAVIQAIKDFKQYLDSKTK